MPTLPKKSRQKVACFRQSGIQQNGIRQKRRIPLGFQTQVEKVFKNKAVGIKTVQHRFPTQLLLMLFHALVMSQLDYSLLFFFEISSSSMLSLGKQMNWALKGVFFCSNIKSFYDNMRKKHVKKHGYHQYTSLDYVQISYLLLSVHQ